MIGWQTGGARHVEQIADAAFRRRASPRPPRRLVEGDEPDAGVPFHQRLGAVAVVDIPIHDQDPFATSPLRGPCRDGHVGQEAEAHGAVCQAVVARGPDRGKGVAVASQGVVQRGQHRPRAAGRSGPTAGVHDGVGVEHAPAAAAERLQHDQVGVGVNGP
jgi:hypothetical protein